MFVKTRRLKTNYQLTKWNRPNPGPNRRPRQRRNQVAKLVRKRPNPIRPRIAPTLRMIGARAVMRTPNPDTRPMVSTNHSDWAFGSYVKSIPDPNINFLALTEKLRENTISNLLLFFWPWDHRLIFIWLQVNKHGKTRKIGRATDPPDLPKVRRESRN